MNREELCELLPHRGPMLLLDELEPLPDHKVRAVARLRGTEWFFSGHFPGNPIVPGVITCEMMAQACCGLLADDLHGKIPYLVKIRSAAFRRPVTAGDCVRVEGELTRTLPPFFEASCRAFVGGQLCAQAELSFILKNATKQTEG